jgi:hypothetical protein
MVDEATKQTFTGLILCWHCEYKKIVNWLISKNLSITFEPSKNKRNMKKNLLFGCLLLSFFGSAQSTHQTQSRVKNVEKIKDYSEFLKSRSTELQLPSYMEAFQYNNSAYEPNYRYDYTYVLSNRIGTEIYSFYNGTEFEKSFRTRYTYGANYEVINYESWNSSLELWENSYLDSSFFDAQGNETKSVSYSYDFGTSSWELNSTQITNYQYSANNEILSATYFSVEENGDLYPQYREVWTWAGGNGPSEGIFQEWDADLEDWLNEARAINLAWHKFSGFLINAATVLFWNGSDWENGFQIEAAYFENDLEQFNIQRSWNGAEFENIYKLEQTIDENMQRTSFNIFYWENDSWALDYAQKFINTYSGELALLQVDQQEFDFSEDAFYPTFRFIYGNHINIASINEAQILGVNIYPNPVHDQLNIVLDEETATFAVMNLAGQTLIAGTASQIMSIHVAELAQGMYVLHISNGKQSNAIKFLKN